MLECIVLIPLNGNDVSMFCLQIFSNFMYMFMGLVARKVNGMVASSSSVRGSGTLQCGIRAIFAAWA